jgi:predicted methyltransferase
MKRSSLLFSCVPLAAALACGSPKPEAAAPAATETRHSEVTADSPEDAAARERLTAILAMPHRTDEERHRDQYRHPVETLTFFGVRPEHTVVELSPGGGWYTNILGPLLAEKGHLVAVTSDPAGKPGYQRDNAVKLRELFATRKDLFGSSEATVMALLADPPRLELGADGSADVVLTFRNAHNWAKAEKLDAVLAAAFKVLKPGGVLGVTDHRAGANQTMAQAMEAGYVPQAWLIERIEAAGFKLVATSEVNANPKDTKDHPNGVWSLPPTLEGKDEGRDKYLAIGESDRMTLKFQKPAN